MDVARFRIAADVDDYYLVVSALVPYKRVDLAVAAATERGRRLLVVGRGPEEARLRAMAGPGVRFLGWRPDAEVAELYARCRAVLFPSVEDFGIVPLEAAAAGRPTLALARGGALETMVGLDGDEPPTAVFFAEQTVAAVVEAMTAFEAAELFFVVADLGGDGFEAAAQLVDLHDQAGQGAGIASAGAVLVHDGAQVGAAVESGAADAGARGDLVECDGLPGRGEFGAGGLDPGLLAGVSWHRPG